MRTLQFLVILSVNINNILEQNISFIKGESATLLAFQNLLSLNTLLLRLSEWYEEKQIKKQTDLY